LQYLGIASGGDGGPAYIRVERALAHKAIVDGRRIGAEFFRLAITGLAPSTHGARGDLELWLKNPDKYWSAMDIMVSDLKQNNIQIVPVLMFNSVQFPAMAGETVGDLFRSPQSRSWSLLSSYVSQFVKRYRDSGVVLFYEFTNELNLSANIDLLRYCEKTQKPDVCALESNFTTDELVLSPAGSSGS